MNSPLSVQAQQTLKDLTSLLAKGKFEEVVAKTKGIRLSAEELKDAVEDYDCELVELPPEAWKLTDVVPVSGSVPPVFSVYQPLWTKEEGASELTLEVTLIEVGPGEVRVEIDDLGVM